MEREKRPGVGETILRLIQGAVIGGGGILPGVSGGVLAVLFGIYRPVMAVLAHPKRELPRYWRMLLPVAIGAVGGFLLGAGGVLTLLRASETVAVCLFFGLVAGTLPALWNTAGEDGRPAAAYGVMFGAFTAMTALFLALRFGLTAPIPAGFWGFFLGGVIMALGVVVPGLASSPLLMALDLFQPMMEGAFSLDFSVLLPLALGVVVTVLALSRLMRYLFQKHYAVVYHAVLGVVAASLLGMIPTSFSGVGEVLLCLLCAAVGAVVARACGKLETKLGVE